MKQRKLTLIAFVAAILSLFAVAQVPNIPQFSADMTMKGKGAGENMTGKMYWGGSKIRMDMDAHGQQVQMINDIPKQTSYMIMPQQHMYMEMNANMRRGPKAPDVKPVDPSNPCSNMADYTCEKQGTETVNGRSCDKWLFKKKDGSEQHTAWVDQKLHFPVRTVTSDGSQFDLTNIQEGKQDASLFEIPSGYQKMDMGGMMGGRVPH